MEEPTSVVSRGPRALFLTNVQGLLARGFGERGHDPGALRVWMRAIIGRVFAEKAVGVNPGVNHGAEVIEVDTAVGGAVRG